MNLLQSTFILISKLSFNTGQIPDVPKNPRFIKTERYEKLKKSLQDNPEMLPARELLVYNYDGELIVIGGNMRLRAAKELGYKEIPCKILEDLTAEQIRAIVIKDNVSFGSDDFEQLANEWDSIELEEWGLEIPTFDEIQPELEAVEDDYTEPENMQVDVCLGDLIEIGQHRLICGDSTDGEQVARLMNGEKADLAHNDPPYGMKKESEGVLNDNLNFNDLLDFNREWIALQFSHLKDNGSWYCWGIDEPLMDIYSEILKPYIKQQKATFRNLITWDKKNPSGLYDGNGIGASGLRMFAMLDEKCLFVMMGVQGFANDLSNWFEGFEKFREYYEVETKKAGLNISKICDLTNSYAGHYFSRSQYAFPTKEHHQKIQSFCKENNIDAFKKEYDQIKKEYDQIKKEYDQIKKEYYSTRAYFNNTHDLMTNIWNIQREKDRSSGHATPKPIPLCERVIKSSCPENGLVIDFFLGSGSTMVAAHQLNRKCYGMELDPKYCQVIIDRMHKLDSSLKIKINGKDYIPHKQLTNV